MPTFLEKIGLQESFTCELEIQQVNFVSRFKKQVDDGDLGFLFDSFDVFSSSNNEYKGRVTDHGFKIRKKATLFPSASHQVSAVGTFMQQDQKLLIHTFVDGVSFSSFIFVLAAVGIFVLILTDEAISTSPIFILLLSLLVFGVPYLFIRRGVKSFRRELESEFLFVIKN